MASNNMYRVGDFVYFETSAGAPYQIRKIEELNKTTTGAVEAKVVCFYRRRDLSNSLLQMADKANSDMQESLLSVLSEEQMHLLKHRELFITRQLETLPATHIRGKARVTQFNDNELALNYSTTENTFFYSLVYDSVQKTIHSGKGSIRIGSNNQTKIQPMLAENQKLNYSSRDYECLMWQPDNKMKNEDIDNFITICRSLGTYARACDLTSSVRQPNLTAAAAAASRDITLMEAFNRLHQANYDFHEAIVLLTPDGAPTLVRDEMEDWSANEGKLFEEGLGKYGKFFHNIYNDFLPWKSPKKLVEFYYMWKTSQHYLQLKRIKRCENEHKLKQVYIPNYTKPNPAVLFTGSLSASSNQSNSGCESCGSLSSGQWFAWGPPNLHCKLCDTCWSYWKRYGGLKNPTRQDRQSKEFQNSSSPQSNNSATTLHKSIATHLYQCPQIGCDKHFRQASQLHNHIATTHSELLDSMKLIDQNNPLLYEEFKNQKNGFFMKPGPEFQIGRQLFRDKLRINFRMSRCFDKENRMRLALKCLTKADLKFHLCEFIKTPNLELLNRKFVCRNFGNIHNVIEKISKLFHKSKEINNTSRVVNLKNLRPVNISSEKPVSSEHIVRPVNETDKRLFVNTGLSMPKRNRISNEALCLVPTFQVTKEIRNLRLKIGQNFLKKLSRKPFHQS